MRLDIVTIFPEYFAPLSLSLIGKARTSGLLDVAVHDLRTWTTDRHRTVDDTPSGGGAGMVMKPEPWGAALDELTAPGDLLVIPTPAGQPFTQAIAAELAARDAGGPGTFQPLFLDRLASLTPEDVVREARITADTSAAAVSVGGAA